TSKALLGATIAAFIFALQMLNFPVAEGTSGHFVGGALAAILLGPAGAIFALAVVLIIQCFVFGDGGVLALGANIFNMGVVGGLVGHYAYKWLKAMFGGISGILFAVFISSWVYVVLAAVSCAIMIGVSGTAPTSDVISSMASIHMLIGVSEGLIVFLVMAMIYKFKPVLFDSKAQIGIKDIIKICIAGCAVALAAAIFVSPYACPFLDGLEKVAEDHEFLHVTEGREIFSALIPDYVFPGIKSEAIATSVAGLAGTIMTFVFFLLTAGVLVFRKEK
ncbi:MAG: energy-coupling factor ABC transporter permease, partial [Candidatus Subteraquimicrobiales bacterium]|nr:energy-coupling factor ABC transporter permease [Candidatus Subteraquimicrobiales bacterium]